MRKNKPQLIGGVLKDVLEKLSQAKKGGISEIVARWPALAGRELARHTRPANLRSRTLLVNVDESAWLYQVNLQKEALLKAVQKKMGKQKIQEIRFRIGKIR